MGISGVNAKINVLTCYVEYILAKKKVRDSMRFRGRETFCNRYFNIGNLICFVLTHGKLIVQIIINLLRSASPNRKKAKRKHNSPKRKIY